MLLCVCSVIHHRWGKKCGKNKEKALEQLGKRVTDILIAIYILLNMGTATWNLSVLYNKETEKEC